jgi:hypothetical protein
VNVELCHNKEGWLVRFKPQGAQDLTVRLPDNFYDAMLDVHETIGDLAKVLELLAEHAHKALDDDRRPNLRLLATDDRPICRRCGALHDRHDDCSVLDPLDCSETP